MAEEPDNLTLSLLREMRDEMREFRAETADRFETLEHQVVGMSGMLTLIYGKLMDHDERIEALEALKPSPAE